MRTDPLQLRVFENHAQAAADSMAYTLFRTAHSTFVKETEDFTTGLATPSGMTFASPRDLGATWFVGLDYAGALGLIASYEEGDICITNDPYSGFVCTHTPDMHIWKPIFWAGELVAFAVGHVHNTDMGGAVPASLSRTLTEVHQEGIRFKPTKLVHQGRLDQGLIDTMMLNVRMPEQNWGDLKAQIAAVNTGERRVHEMIRRFGIDLVRDGMQDLLDLGEARARQVIAALPDGDFRFVDYLDEDGPGGQPVRLALTLRVRGDAIEMDFTGSDPQLQASLNMPTGGNPRHILLMVGYDYCLYTLDPTIPLNGGILRAATCIVPEGSVLNPQHPAAVGMRSLTCARLQGVVMGAFQAAAPDRLPAGPAGGGGIVNVKSFDSRSGRIAMASIDPVVGGAGGSARGDGTDGAGANSGFLKNTPIEINEIEVPVKFLRYGLVPDSGGAGEARGGLATELEVQVFPPNTIVTARNRDRSVFAAWGTQGGSAGMTSRFVRRRPDGTVEDLGNTDVVEMQPGEVFNLTSGGGGGWGNPLARAVERVEHDVRGGKVSAAAAERDYGVVMAGDRVDLPATEILRDRLFREQAIASVGESRDGKGHNASRIAFEAVWTEGNYEELTRALAKAPVQWRHYLKRQVFDFVAAMPAPGRRGDGSDVRAALRDITQRLPQVGDWLDEVSP